MVNADQLPHLFAQQINLNRLGFDIRNCDNWTDLEALSQIQVGDRFFVIHTGPNTDLNGFPMIQGSTFMSINSNSLRTCIGMPNIGISELWLQCPNLERLDGLENAPNLEEIELGKSNLSDWHVLVILHHLRKLRIGTSCEDYNGLVYAQSLERLDISNAKTFKNFRLQAGGFDNLPNLKTLYLCNNDGLSLDGLAEFAPNIEELDIWESSLSKEYVMHFFEEAKSKGQFQKLRALSVSAQRFSKAEVERLSKILELPVVSYENAKFGREIPSSY